MRSREEIIKNIKRLVKEFYSLRKYEFVPGKTRIPLQVPSYGYEEVCEILDSLLSTWVTMGEKVKNFEQLFAEYLGIKYAIMVNSGSSANLISLSILTNPAFKSSIPPGSEIITPATTWATTVYPIVNVNCTPVLVDVDLETFNIKVDEIKTAITPKTKAIIPVHLLGNPCEIVEIMEIAEKYNLRVIEDACEAHGAEVNGKKVGTFGDMGTFSFFFSHHITTIEGGMIVTNNEEYDELARALRVFGWARHTRKFEEYAKKYSNIDKRFLFINVGFNFRPTEIQGAMGIHQIKKLEKFIKIRRKNAKYWNKKFEPYSDYIITQKERPKTRHVWFGYPITVKPQAPFSRDEMVKYLEEKGIETRPIQIPNITQQPVINLIPHKIVSSLKNANYIMENSFWFGNHQGIGKVEREYIADVIINFIEEKLKDSSRVKN
ncbi:MAG: DegT/DnrJ/EryC1/StrS family aminotransferase [Candidatus Aenigmatarchaeota archaeon]